MLKQYLSNRLLKNGLSLLSSQSINYIFPLLTYPYLIRVLNLENFGKITFVMTIMSFANVYVDFGYNLIAPREVAKHSSDQFQLNQTVSKIITLKFLLFVSVFFFLFFFFYYLWPSYSELFAGGAIYLLSLVMIPNWFFQGIQKMEYIAIVDFISKLVFTLLVFFIVKSPQDTSTVLLLWGVGGILSGVVGYVLIFRNFGIHYLCPRMEVIKDEFAIGMPYFVSNISTFFFNNSNILILGLLSGNVALGIYSIAEKLAKLPWTIVAIISQVVYPKACELSIQGIRPVQSFFSKIMKIVILLTVSNIALLLLFNKFIISIFTHGTDLKTRIVFAILVISTLPIAFNIPYNQVLLIFGSSVNYLRIFVATALCNLVIAISCIYAFDSYGAAVSHLLTMITLLSFIYYEYTKILKEVEK